MDALGFTVRFVLAVLATWRVTHLLAAEDGPADIIVRFRALLGNSLAGTLMDCFNCLSIWIAAAASLFVTRHWLEWLMTWLAVSGAACLLERVGQQPVLIRPNAQLPQGGINDVLWTETSGTQEQHGPIDAHDSFASSHDVPEPAAVAHAGKADYDSGSTASNRSHNHWPDRRI